MGSQAEEGIVTHDEHVKEAEKLLKAAAAASAPDKSWMAAAVYAARAQAHATVALAVHRGSNFQEPEWYREEEKGRKW